MNIFPGLFHKKLGLSGSKLHSINFLQRNIKVGVQSCKHRRLLGKPRATPRPFGNVAKMVDVLMVIYVGERGNGLIVAYGLKGANAKCMPRVRILLSRDTCCSGVSGCSQLFLSMVHRELEEPIMLHQTNHDLHITLDRYVPNQFSPNAELSYQYLQG